MAFEVKCANCNLYFPLDSVKQSGDGYYCKACYKRLKNRQCVPITSNMEARCARCDKTIGPDEAKVKDGDHVYCLRCYISSQMPPREEAGPDIIDDILERLHIAPPQESRKPAKGKARDKEMPKDPQCECANCGKTMSRHYDDPIQDGGKYYCKECYDKTRKEPLLNMVQSGGYKRLGATSMRSDEKLIECTWCGMVMTVDRLAEDEDGKIRCQKCKKELPIRIRSTWEAKAPAPRADAARYTKEDFSAIAQLFKGLGDPCRVKIIELLSDHELCVFEFVEMTGFQYSAISYHLKMLKELGMIKAYERGNFMVYSLTEKGEAVHEFIEKSKGLS